MHEGSIPSPGTMTMTFFSAALRGFLCGLALDVMLYTLAGFAYGSALWSLCIYSVLIMLWTMPIAGILVGVAEVLLERRAAQGRTKGRVR